MFKKCPEKMLNSLRDESRNPCFYLFFVLQQTRNFIKIGGDRKFYFYYFIFYYKFLKNKENVQKVSQKYGSLRGESRNMCFDLFLVLQPTHNFLKDWRR